ncbi:hypothetical protein [Roseisolibacter agri]|uniref:Uncharacterized protein n=1 Tax=Roseisolibacter agri TaxID=2014610 RepID=A0AA37V144_9BACT|nr:hypothetical protein [Roseisolibacter agri]GLC25600.1 hypothetical protein rosag_21130 [Roseisolibacter agri]
MPDDTPTPINFNVYVKLNTNAAPKQQVTLLDGNNAAIGKLKVPTGSTATITFSQANGSQDLYFSSFLIQATPFSTFPPRGSPENNPAEFKPLVWTPGQTNATSLTVPDTNVDASSTDYHYAVGVVAKNGDGTVYWNDPEIVNHSESSPELPAVRLPDDMPAVSPTFGRTASATDVSAPPPV